MGGWGWGVLITSLIHPLIHSFIRSFIHSFIHSAEQAACTAEERVHNRANLCACTGEAKAPPPNMNRMDDLVSVNLYTI